MPKTCINKKCKRDLQDDYLFCPYCGRCQEKSTRKNKRPNGTGSIYQRKDIKSKPWAASSTITGKRVYLGSFPTRTAAVKALAEYEANPTTGYNITLAQLHSKWMQSKSYTKLGESTKSNYKTSWDKLSPLYNRKMKDLRKADYQAIIDYYEGKHQKRGVDGKLMYIDDKGKHTYKVTNKPYIIDGLKYSALHKIKCLLTKMYPFAMEDDIVNKNYASFIELPDPNEVEKTSFTDIQLEIIRQNIYKVPFADYIYCLCYLGFRVSEFLELTKDNYYISDTGIPLFVGGKKTEAGTNRPVPIHEKIRPIVNRQLKRNGQTIFCDENGNALNKDKFREQYFYPALDALDMPRTLTPHSCRRTFSTRLSATGVRPEVIIALMGHTNFDTDIKHYINHEADTLYNALKLMA